jgi:hypothetical protein
MYSIMEKIEDIFNVLKYVEDGKFVIKLEGNNSASNLTELKVLKFFNKFENILNQLYDERIKTFYFIFDISKIKIPTNVATFLKDFSKILVKHEKVIIEKLDFTIVQSSSNIFKLFFNLFKYYYKPINSLYLCDTLDDCKNCLHNENERNKYPNILSIM